MENNRSGVLDKLDLSLTDLKNGNSFDIVVNYSADYYTKKIYYPQIISYASFATYDDFGPLGEKVAGYFKSRSIANIKMKLFSLGHLVTPSEANYKLHEMGIRPANLVELFAFWDLEVIKSSSEKFRIYATGSKIYEQLVYRSTLHVPYLEIGNDGKISLSNYHHNIDKYSYILVVVD